MKTGDLFSGASGTALLFLASVAFQGALTPAFGACPGTIVDGETQVVTQNLAVGDNCNVESGGSIATGAGAAIDAVGNNTINNAGAISTTGVNSRGIDADDDSTITNSGSISTLLNGSDGIEADNNNTVGNSGSIGTNGNGSNGILVEQNNFVVNDGTITTSGNLAFGIRGEENNKIVNNGSIETMGNSSGISVDDNNTVTNQGSITTSGNLSSGIGADDNNVIDNSGSISTTGFGSSGINVINSSKVTNSGSINTTGVLASGIQAQVGNTVSNNGSITVTGDNTGAIVVDADNTVTNSGSIFSTGANGSAVLFGGAGNLLHLLPGSVLFGNLDFVAGNTLAVGPGLSIVATFNNQLPDTLNTFGAPFAISGNQIAVVDPTSLAAQDEMLADLTSGIFNSVHARMNGAGRSASNDFSGFGLGGSSLMQLGNGSMMHLSSYDVTPVSSDTRSGFWAQAFGGVRDEDADGPTTGSEHKLIGGIAGFDGIAMPGVRLGGFAGGSRAEMETSVGSQDLDVESFFGGGYVSARQSSWFVHVMLTAGKSDYDSTREVANNLAAGGLQAATASFDGTFVSPEVTIGTTIRMGGVIIEPSVRGRYAHLSLDGYTETGAADAFAVGDRDISLWQGRAQVAFPMSSSQGTFSPRIGIEGRSSDNENVSAVLIGQAISFDPGGNDGEVSGFVGATASTSLGSGISAFVDGEIHGGEGGYVRTEARAGVTVRF